MERSSAHRIIIFIFKKYDIEFGAITKTYKYIKQSGLLKIKGGVSGAVRRGGA